MNFTDNTLQLASLLLQEWQDCSLAMVKQYTIGVVTVMDTLTKTLVERILTHASYKDVKNNTECECLIIDEIGLMSQHLFDAVEFICQNVKGNTKLFGDIQIIGSGSFKQLPPVPSYSDPGFFCFQSQSFDNIFAHHVSGQGY